MITKAFLLISSLTGVAIMHAHHTPKDRAKQPDWVRGDASAWRGSGAIYSALDCGFTLANWMPYNTEQRKAWASMALSKKLSRWIVLDTGKIREGEALDPVVYELVGQEMDEGEGAPIGVCRLSTESEAADALLAGAVSAITHSELARDMIQNLGAGEFKSMAHVDKKMQGHMLWPDLKQARGKQRLFEMLGDKVVVETGSVQMIQQNKGKWQITIEGADDATL
jgi:hypothetical protein